MASRVCWVLLCLWTGWYVVAALIGAGNAMRLPEAGTPEHTAGMFIGQAMNFFVWFVPAAILLTLALTLRPRPPRGGS